ncbi:MAG TPA: glycoside hydrolase family 9 protein [Bacteroidota bacterium]|nr:glycoside hydrolase family 9 protein [Bacteroidota bacterium]
MNRLLLPVAALFCLVSIASAQSWIRVNQLGYLPHATKAAVLASKDPALAVKQFEIQDAHTGAKVQGLSTVQSGGAYGPFASTWRLDFSQLTTPGTYVIAVDTIRSPSFRIGADVYDGTADFLLRYMRQQRCGYNPFLRDSCHTRDGYIIYSPGLDSTFIDVTGGWHDAADYLQYVTTSASATYQMLFAYEENPEAFQDSFQANGLPGPNGIPDVLDEARWGLEWLLKMNPSAGMMFNQIADDRDHLGFRLPSEDTVNYGRGKERPVYRCTGKPQGILQYVNRATGIASTAGKFASAFAMGAMLYRNVDSAFARIMSDRARSAYDYGQANPGVCQTAPCRAPYFYEEDNWVDDMELAAVQLARLTGDRQYLSAGASFAAQEPVVPWIDGGKIRHYQWYPFVNLGHVGLARLDSGQIRASAIEHLRNGMERFAARARTNAFRMGVPFIWCSNNLVSSFLTHARLYRDLSGDRSYLDIESGMRDWLWGCNPWGTSMVIGLPRGGTAPRDPHSAYSHVHGYPVDGGLVDGPVAGSVFSSLKGVSLSRPDPFAAFQSDLAVYHDDWADYSTNEPTMDGTAGLIMAMAELECEGKEERFAGRYQEDALLSAALLKIVQSEGLEGVFNTEDGPEQISLALIDLTSAPPRLGGVHPHNFIYPASVYKMYVAAEVLHQISDGKRRLTDTVVVRSPNVVDTAKEILSDPRPLLRNGDIVTVNHLLDLMITRSDNTAANCLIDLARRENINALMHRYGWHGSEVTRKFLKRKFEDPGYATIRGTETCAMHAADFMYRVQTSTLVDPWVSQQMKALLGRQLDKSKLAQGLPDSAMYYHKTGWYSTWTHDVGIVDDGAVGYVLACFLPLREERALATMKELSARIYKLMRRKGR